MSDLVNRLRDDERSEWAICNEAADEIERLRAALAQPAPAVPDGWVMVPAEATREMCVAAVKLNNGNAVYKNVAAAALEIEEQIYAEVYEAMIAAAPGSAPAAPAVREPLTARILEIISGWKSSTFGWQTVDPCGEFVAAEAHAKECIRRIGVECGITGDSNG